MAVAFPSFVLNVTVALRWAAELLSPTEMFSEVSPLPLVAPSVTQDSAQFAVQSAFAVTLTDLVSAVAEKESSVGETEILLTISSGSFPFFSQEVNSSSTVAAAPSKVKSFLIRYWFVSEASMVALQKWLIILGSETVLKTPHNKLPGPSQSSFFRISSSSPGEYPVCE